MHLSSMYYIIFIVAVILASILILFTHWRYKVWQRESLAKQCRDSAVIQLRTNLWQGFNCASSVRILKVDGKKAKSFLYRWPWKQAIYVASGEHSMEVRADWPIRTYSEYIWYHYTVNTLLEVGVEAGMHYALEYEVSTDTWTLFQAGRGNAPAGEGKVSKKFVRPEGYVSDNHVRVWNIVILILWLVGILYIKYG